MRRRTFIRNSSLIAASSFLIPVIGCRNMVEPKAPFQLLESLHLTDFDDEQDESPILFQNKQDSYLTTLRRLEYPSDKEIISLFKLEDGNWKEQEPVSTEPGSYEAISADCHVDGAPAVAWTSIENGQWIIKVSIQANDEFLTAVKISNADKRSINPIVKAVSEDSFVVAWECFDEGKFSIYFSRYKNGVWSDPVLATDASKQSFDPAIEQDEQGQIYLAYDCSDGPHRNIEMKIFSSDLREIKSVPIAIGGGFKHRVNINVKPNLAFDKWGKLWVSWENNRFAHRLQDSDNYTGDRCCGMVCYNNGALFQQKENGRWLFKEKNDHWPSFYKDFDNNLYLISHCGGDFTGNPHWKFRISNLDPKNGWSQPVTILQTKQKGESIRPSIIFDKSSSSLWMAWKSEQFIDRDYDNPNDLDKASGKARRGMLEINRFETPGISYKAKDLNLVSTIVEEHHDVNNYIPELSGRPKSKRTTISHKGETYTLLLGNLHEHSEISSCWPAGTDGTLHDDYRYGLCSEGYDFIGITDHAYSQTEVYWRKHLRLADFYNDATNFIAFPSVEFTLSNNSKFEIKRGAGHRNIIFNSTEDAKKYIRNKDQVYSVNNPETKDAEKLWAYIRSNNLDCISIPHHPADKVHACCWETRDQVLEPVVEIFQCRGNAEYRGAPRMINLDRHVPSENDKGFIDYALRDKKYKLGFIASGDHNNMGVGLACVWVKEISRKGILEAFRNRRVFATTGDQIIMDFRLNGQFQGQTIKGLEKPNLSYRINAADRIETLDILRNSKVISTIHPEEATQEMIGEFVDDYYTDEKEVLYYYIRVIQHNKHIAWSSPIWIDA